MKNDAVRSYMGIFKSEHGIRKTELAYLDLRKSFQGSTGISNLEHVAFVLNLSA